MRLSEAKLQQLDAVATFRVYGHALEDDEPEERIWWPISPCFCVQHSPENPCPCIPEFVWWLPRRAIVGQGSADRKTRGGEQLQYFDVLVDSRIMVESVQPVTAGALKGLGDRLSPEAVRDLASGGSAVGVAARPDQDAIRDKALREWLKSLYGSLFDAIFGSGEGVIERWVKENRKRMEESHGKPPS